MFGFVLALAPMKEISNIDALTFKAAQVIDEGCLKAMFTHTTSLEVLFLFNLIVCVFQSLVIADLQGSDAHLLNTISSSTMKGISENMV